MPYPISDSPFSIACPVFVIVCNDELKQDGMYNMQAWKGTELDDTAVALGNFGGLNCGKEHVATGIPLNKQFSGAVIVLANPGCDDPNSILNPRNVIVNMVR